MHSGSISQVEFKWDDCKLLQHAMDKWASNKVWDIWHWTEHSPTMNTDTILSPGVIRIRPESALTIFINVFHGTIHIEEFFRFTPWMSDAGCCSSILHRITIRFSIELKLWHLQIASSFLCTILVVYRKVYCRSGSHGWHHQLTSDIRRLCHIKK